MQFRCYKDFINNGFRPPAGIKNIMVYDFAQQFIKEGHYIYEYKCSFDPTGNRIGCLHYIRKKKPQVPRTPIIRVLGGKIWRFYFAHYDPEKYQEQMKKYKEGKLKSRPNGRTWCLIKARPRLGLIDPNK